MSPDKDVAGNGGWKMRPSEEGDGRLMLTSPLRVDHTDVFVLREKEASRKEAEPGETETKEKARVAEDAPLLLTPEQRYTPPAATGSALREKIAALEAAVAQTRDLWEPDGDGREDDSGRNPPNVSWPDKRELKKPGSALAYLKSADPVQPGASGLPQTGSSAGTLGWIDDTALRSLITEIVRAELNDTLSGMNESPNLRKLIQRELYRALVAAKSK